MAKIKETRTSSLKSKSGPAKDLLYELLIELYLTTFVVAFFWLLCIILNII